MDATSIDITEIEREMQDGSSPVLESVVVADAPLAGVTLTIVMPAFNEATTVVSAVDGVLALDLPCPFELIVVNDGSTDETAEIVQGLWHPSLRVIHQSTNQGKGAAVRAGIMAASGSHLLVFDADMEYDTADIACLVEPLLDGEAEVVYGTRDRDQFAGQKRRFVLGNRFMTAFANVVYGTDVTDIHTCLKLAPVALLREFDLRERGFGLDTEITARLLRSGAVPFEVPISYNARSRDDGKKITWRDGVRCLWLLLRLRYESVPPVVTVLDLDASVGDAEGTVAMSRMAV